MLFLYIRQQKRNLILYLSIFFVEIVIFDLTKLPLKPVLYSLGLCTVFAAEMFLAGFLQFRRKYKLLLEADFSDSLDALPTGDSALEILYQEKLSRLFAEKQQLIQKMQEQEQQTFRYYTTWVHQIKTPISAMNLILQENGENQELKGELFKIRQYVDMVLSYQRLGSDSSDFVFSQLRLDDVVRSAIRSCSGQFIRQKVALDFQETNYTLISDEKWLQFVLEQLFSNCLKYAPGGKVTIFCQGDVLYIQDNGIGIAPEDLPRIFEMGYTGLNGRSTRATTGIGLYLCREIMNRLGHGISVRSTPGQGTTVLLDFSQNHLAFE